MISTSPEQTKQIAAEFARTLKGGEVVLLEGDLGAGKTTFVQGLVGVFSHDREVRSPTFTIVNIYPVSHDRIKAIVHADLYRIKDASELPALGLEEWLGRKDTVVLVEWPEMAKGLVGPLTPKTARFSTVNETSRSIEFT